MKNLSLLVSAFLLFQSTSFAQAPDTLWTKTYGENTSEEGNKVKQNNDGGYKIVGYIDSFGAGKNDVWLIKLNADSPSEVKNKTLIVDEFFIEQNYPNPFNPVTTIKYQIPELTFVILKVYDGLGNEIATIVNDQKPAGGYEVKFNATSLPSGVYFYRVQVYPVNGRAGSFIETKKMVLLR